MDGVADVAVSWPFGRSEDEQQGVELTKEAELPSALPDTMCYSNPDWGGIWIIVARSSSERKQKRFLGKWRWEMFFTTDAT